MVNKVFGESCSPVLSSGAGLGIIPLVVAQFQHQHSLCFALEETFVSSLGALRPGIKGCLMNYGHSLPGLKQVGSSLFRKLFFIVFTILFLL